MFCAGQDDSIYRQGDADTAMGGELAALVITMLALKNMSFLDKLDTVFYLT